MPRPSPPTVALVVACAGLGGAASLLLGPVGPPRSEDQVVRLPVTVAVPAVSPDSQEIADDDVARSLTWLRARQADMLSPPPVEAGLGRPNVDRAEGVDNTRGRLRDDSDASGDHR